MSRNLLNTNVVYSRSIRHILIIRTQNKYPNHWGSQSCESIHQCLKTTEKMLCMTHENETAHENYDT